jgi:hypothetical protein
VHDERGEREMRKKRSGETAIATALLLSALALGAYGGQNEWTAGGPNAVVNRVIARSDGSDRLYAWRGGRTVSYRR